MRTRILSAFAALLLCGSLPAHAVIVTVSGEQWSVTTVTGTFTALESTLTAQTWWGSQERAGEFISAVGSSLGVPPENAPNGPFFAVLRFSTNLGEERVGLYAVRFGQVVSGGFPTTTNQSWAIAARVPEPSTFGLMAVALLTALLGVHRRSRGSRLGPPAFPSRTASRCCLHSAA